MLEFREPLFSKGKLGGILQINVLIIMRPLISCQTLRTLFISYSQMNPPMESPENIASHQQLNIFLNLLFHSL